MNSPVASPLRGSEVHGGWLGRYFFPLGWTTRIAAMRILCVGLYLLWFNHPLAFHTAFLEADGFDKPQWLMALIDLTVGQENYRQAWVLTTVQYVGIASGLLALVGLFSRLSVGVFTLTIWLQVSHTFSYDEIHHVETLFAIFLAMLAFSPCGDCLSLDAWRRQRRESTHTPDAPLAAASTATPVRRWWEGSYNREAFWPIVGIQVLLALAYFDAAVSKLLIGGPHWFNGYTMQNILLTDGLRHDRPLGVYFAQFRELAILMAVFAVAYEGLFWLVLVPRVRRWAVPAFLAAGFMLHVGIFVLQNAPFFMWLALYCVWLPWERLPGLRPRGLQQTLDQSLGIWSRRPREQGKPPADELASRLPTVGPPAE